MYSRFITSQAVKILVCPVDQQRLRQAERQLPPALPPVAARNLSGNNPIDFKTFLFSGPHPRKRVKAWKKPQFAKGHVNQPP